MARGRYRLLAGASVLLLAGAANAQQAPEGAAAQLEASIAALEADLEAARKRKDRSAIREAEAALVTRRSWLAQVRKTASEG